MPKPLLIARDSGLYVRFRVPNDLREVVGSRFIVRPIRHTGDAARLASAYLGMVLSRAFDSLRRGGAVDIKKAMDAAKVHIDLTLDAVELPNGVVLRGVRVETPDDERQLEYLPSWVRLCSRKAMNHAISDLLSKRTFLSAPWVYRESTLDLGLSD